jgi:hypothetical protein
MGWSALYGAPFHNVNETIVETAAAGLASGGLSAAGYEYIVLDDWYAGRDGSGKIIANKDTFPSGMPAVSASVHNHGLLFGVYSAAGQRTCANYSASLFREVDDANTFANDWKIDYLKYDACRYNSGIISRARYLTMSRALNATGRNIFYSVEGWNPSQGNWGPELANMWRTGNDIWPDWDQCILNNLYTTNDAASYMIPGKAFNDPDMLQPPASVPGTTRTPGLTFEEARAQFVLWCVMKAPLMLGVNFAQLATLKTEHAYYFDVITNKELIAIDQDPSHAAVLVAQMPSKAQQQRGSILNLTFQSCDPHRVDQQFVEGTLQRGSIQAAGTNLCLSEGATTSSTAVETTTSLDAVAEGEGVEEQRVGRQTVEEQRVGRQSVEGQRVLLHTMDVPSTHMEEAPVEASIRYPPAALPASLNEAGACGVLRDYFYYNNSAEIRPSGMVNGTADCCALCGRTPRCKAFSFYKKGLATGPAICRLYATPMPVVVPGHSDQAYDSGNFGSPAPAPPVGPSPPPPPPPGPGPSPGPSPKPTSNTVSAVPCAAGAVEQVFGLARDSQFHTAPASGSKRCLLAQPTPGTNLLGTATCISDGKFPPPLNDHSAIDDFVWDSTVGQIVGGSSGQCITVGQPNYPPLTDGKRARWVTNNGTLEHEVWVGPLSSGQQVVVLFNKGASAEAVSAHWTLLNQPDGRPAPVRDVLAQKDLTPLAPGSALVAQVGPHGVQAFVVGWAE